MPGYFKKRRGPQGPNKNEEKVIRAREAEGAARLAGTIGSKFPSVKSLKVGLTFLGAHGQKLDEKTMTLGPDAPLLFTVPCPGMCGRGSFNFGTKIAETVEAALPFSESGAKCPEPLYAGSADACGCEVRCRMDVDYFPAPPAEKLPATAPPAGSPAAGV